MDLRGALQLRTKLAGPGMEALEGTPGDAPIEDVPKQLVSVVEESPRPRGIEECLIDEFLQGRVERGRRQVHDAREDFGDEAATDHRSGLRNGSSLRREPREPREDRILDRGGHGRFPDRVTVRPPCLAKRAEQLLDVERDPIRSLVDRRNDLTRRWQTGREDERRHQGGLLNRERGEPGLLGHPLRQEPSAPLPEHRACRKLVGPVRTDHQDGPVADATRELPDDLETQVVGPLEVLEREHRRRVQGFDDPVDHVDHQEPARSKLTSVRTVRQGQEIVAELDAGRVPEHRPGEIEHQRCRHGPILRGDRTLGDLESLG